MIIPKEYQLGIQKFILDYHISLNKDFLLVQLPLWLKVFANFEMFIQLPIFFIGSYKLKQKSLTVYPILMIYGFNAFFTTLVCLIYVWYDGVDNGLSDIDIYKLIAVYLPYLFIPLVMLLDCGIKVTRLLKSVEANQNSKKNI